MSWETKTSDRPTLAPPDYATLPRMVAVDAYTWHGSGFEPRAALGERFPFEDDMRACGHCGSQAAICIFFHYFHHIVESDVRVELACRACGKFTVHSFERL